MTLLNITPSHSSIKIGESATVYAQIDVTAPAVSGAATKRPPLDIIVVLDRSGSMGTDMKMENARRAAAYVATCLGADDRIGILAYDDHLEWTHELSSQHSHAARSVENIHARGMTALAPALYSALDSLKTDGDRQCHVFLLSDGQANVGDQDPEVIASKIAAYVRGGIRVSTFGLGNDYNELLMERIAVAGGGGYHYLRNADDAPAAFAAELDEVFNLTVRNAQLQIKATSGVKVEALLGIGADDGSLTDVNIGDIAAGAVRTVVAKLSVSASKAKSRKLLSAALTAQVGQDEKTQSTHEAAVKVSQAAKVDAGAINASVMALVAELEAAEAQRQAALAADARDFVRSEAILTDALNNLTANVEMYGENELVLTKMAALQMDAQSVADGGAAFSAESAKLMRASSYGSRNSRR